MSDWPEASLNAKACSIEGCKERSIGRGWCRSHYDRWRRWGDPNASRASEAYEFFRNVVLRFESDDCLVWPFTADPKGYGQVQINGKSEKLHRLICETFNGPPALERNVAAHSCGNSRCANYRHLRWATRAENSADMVKHGTSVRGERSSSSKLTQADILAIRSEAVATTKAALGRKFNVSHVTIHKIVKGSIWAWVA